MNIVVTQTAINASVSDQNISASLTQTPISVSATISNVSASLTQTQINSSVQQGSGVSVSLYQTPVNVTVSSGGGGGISDAPFDSLLYGRRNGAWTNITGTGGGSSLPVADTQTIVMGSVDPTKLLRFEVDGFSAGATRVLTPPNQNATVAGLEVAQTFTANQIIDARAAVGNDAELNHNLYPLGFAGFGSWVTADVSLSVHEIFTTAYASDVHLFHGIVSGIVANPSGSAVGNIYEAMTFSARTEFGNTQPINVLMGVAGFAEHFGDGDLFGLYGVYPGISNVGAGDITLATTVFSYTDHYGTGVITEQKIWHGELWNGGTVITAYGAHISIFDDGGSCTTGYGIKIEDVNLASTNYAIYTGAGDVSFGDNLFLRVIKSGATQAAAGAAAGEVWKTNGHATLPNNVLMIGV